MNSMVRSAANFGTVWPPSTLCRQQLAGLARLCRGRRIVERQVEDFLEFDDVVDLGPHRDVGDAFENELDDEGTLCCAINSRAVSEAPCASFGSVTRIALQPRPSATAM